MYSESSSSRINSDEFENVLEFMQHRDEEDQMMSDSDNDAPGDDDLHQKDLHDNVDVVQQDANNDVEQLGRHQYRKHEYFYSPSCIKHCVPNVPDEMRPKVDTYFSSENEFELMYYRYAVSAGFDVRKYTSKIVGGIRTHRYLVCNRQGKPSTSPVDTLDPKRSREKRSSMHRRECMAGIKFVLDKTLMKYHVYEVEEMHNHDMLSVAQMAMSRAKKKLDSHQRAFIYKMSHQNVGAKRAHRLYTEIQGGYNNNVSTPTYFKNCIRDLNSHVGDKDYQMLINKMENRKNNVTDFSFYYREENSRLNSLFWADDTSKIHYKEFGDIVSFDATFRTNRYDMVFVPFTGVDNHKRSVTFGAGLLSREDTYSYTWLLQAFLKTFKKPPILILSDQDAAMKKAIGDVFPQSNHRLCMWHITSKLSNKVSNGTYHEKNFKKKFNSLVWNSRLTTQQFEEGWNEFINEYDLHDNRWFKDMFNIRDQWIPAYFKHKPFAGLMRTTSRSESENAAFQKSVDPGTSLVDFMISFESSMERQRFQQCSLDYDDVHKYPPKKTNLELEKKAYNYYTKDMFFQVQIELYHALYSCSQWNVNKDGTNEIWCVREKKNRSVVLDGNTSKKVVVEYGYIEWDSNIHQNDFQVICNVPENYFSCSCKLFEHVGILCRHIFCLLKWYNIEDIPKQYLIRRWSKNLIPIEKLRRTFRYGDLDEDADKVAIDVFLSIDKCVSALSSNKEQFYEYIQCIKDLEDRFIGSASNNSSGSRTAEYDNLLGVSTPDEITIQNPDGIRNKGTAKRTRMKSSQEIVVVQKTNEPRTCNYCHQKVYHDIRNCPVRIAYQQTSCSKKNN